MNLLLRMMSSLVRINKMQILHFVILFLKQNVVNSYSHQGLLKKTPTQLSNLTDKLVLTSSGFCLEISSNRSLQNRLRSFCLIFWTSRLFPKCLSIVWRWISLHFWNSAKSCLRIIWTKCICPSCKMHFFKLQKAFLQIAKCICQSQMYLPISNVFVQIAECWIGIGFCFETLPNGVCGSFDQNSLLFLRRFP